VRDYAFGARLARGVAFRVMKRDTKFNYGFLFVSLGAPLIADFFLGRKWAVIVAIVITVGGFFFLLAGHRHHEKDDPPVTESRWNRAIIFGLISAVLGFGAIGIMAVVRQKESGEETARLPVSGDVASSATTKVVAPPARAEQTTVKPKSPKHPKSHDNPANARSAVPCVGTITQFEGDSHDNLVEGDQHLGGAPPCYDVRTVQTLGKAPHHNTVRDITVNQGSGNVPVTPMSQECAPGANCAMSSGQQGGITAGTVNLGGALPRHLSDDDIAGLKSGLVRFHSKVTLGVMAGASDGFPLANQLVKAFHDAGISVNDYVSLRSPSGGSQIYYGIQIQFHGDAVPPDAIVAYYNDSQLGILVSALKQAHLLVAATHSEPSQPEDTLDITILLNPAERH